MHGVLLTGFPGFLASTLLPRLADVLPDGPQISCLVEARFEDLAARRASAVAQQSGCSIRVVRGDITLPDLGLGTKWTEIAGQCRQVFHLAAIYDLAVSRDVATRVNVDGTRHLLDFAADCPRLERFHHVSTCYVSGRHPGRFTENDLDVGQRFGNHYESTKYESEVLVQTAATNGLPTTVYRPSIVSGDSTTGRTQKMDGPYFFIQWLLAQPRLAVMPVFRASASATMNIVPSDYVTGAIAYLCGVRKEALQVYSLADPAPLTVPELTDLLAAATGRRALRVPATRGAARGLVRALSRLHPALDIPGEAVEYLGHPTHYDCTNAVRDLKPSGITCPPLSDYVHRLVSFVAEEKRRT